MKKKPWSGRFDQETSSVVERFTQSLDIDKRLYSQDIEGSITHANMLLEAGIITGQENDAIIKCLCSIKNDIESGSFTFDPVLEDVHMNIEMELTRRIGDAGKKLHTARSRNDQVATDFRLFVRAGLAEIQSGLRILMQVLVEKAGENVDTIIPGMTHLQHAQPVSLAHHLLAYFEMFLRDYDRVSSTGKRINISPLGSAALAGTPHSIDRAVTARSLGFDAPARNSIDAVSDRDFAIESVFDLSMIMMHLSRLAEEIIIWNSQPFSFIDLPDGYCTGSSIMPQKKNPDVAELVRGKTGRVYGDLVSLLTMMKALPLAYNRDMQEDKQPVIESLDTINACLEVMAGLVSGISFNKEALDRSITQGFITATDVADYLVEKGMPFRQAHHVTGEVVASLIRQGKTLDEFTLDEYRSFSDLFDNDIYSAIRPGTSVDRRTSYGGTARDNIRAQLKVSGGILDELEENW